MEFFKIVNQIFLDDKKFKKRLIDLDYSVETFISKYRDLSFFDKKRISIAKSSFFPFRKSTFSKKQANLTVEKAEKILEILKCKFDDLFYFKQKIVIRKNLKD